MAEVLAPPAVDAASDFAGVVAMINSASPEALYLRAAALDRAAERLEDVLTRFRNVSRQISNEWAGRSAGAYSGLAQEIAHGTDRVVAAMTAPSWGAQLRAAGDALAAGQARMRELAAQRAQYVAAVTPATPAAPGAEEQFVAAARQILQGVSSSYQQAGAGISPLPGGSTAGDGTPGGDASGAATRGEGQDVATATAGGGPADTGPAGAAYGAPGGAPAMPVSAVTGRTAGPAETGNLQAAGLQVPGQEVPGQRAAGQQVPAGGPAVGPGFTVPGAGAEGASPATTTGATTPVSPSAASSAGVVGGPAPSDGVVGAGYAASPGGLSPFAVGAPAVAGVLGQPPVTSTAAGPAAATRRAAAGAEPVSGELQSAAMPFAAGPAVLGRSVAPAAGVAASRNAPEESPRRAATWERPSTTAAPEQEAGTAGLMAAATLPAPSPPAFAQATASAGGVTSGVPGGAPGPSGGAPSSGGSSSGGSLPGVSLPGGSASAGALPGGASTPGGGGPLPLPDLRSVAGASDAGRFSPSASLPGSTSGPGSMSGSGPVSGPGSGSVSLPGSVGPPPVRPLVTDLSAVTTPPPALPGTGSAAASGRAPAADPFGAGGNPMGHPMMPMGGMGMGPQDTERETDRQYDVAFAADDDAWGAQDGVPAALGRPGRR